MIHPSSRTDYKDGITASLILKWWTGSYIPTQVEVVNQNFVFTTFLFDVQYYRNSVKNNPAKSLVVSLEI